MPKTFIIAEAGSSHDAIFTRALDLIEAAKECGADAVKFQATSDPAAMAERRCIPEAVTMYDKYLLPVMDWLPLLKAKCDDIGIEFMVTSYLPKDIAVIAPFVKRFKISKFESGDQELLDSHLPFKKQIIMSRGPGSGYIKHPQDTGFVKLYCVSKYPCPLEDLHLRELWRMDTLGRFIVNYSGISDHTGNILTGALAVAAGAGIVECHIRLSDTSGNNPDYHHSLVADEPEIQDIPSPFSEYVHNIRQAEKML